MSKPNMSASRPCADTILTLALGPSDVIHTTVVGWAGRDFGVRKLGVYLDVSLAGSTLNGPHGVGNLACVSSYDVCMLVALLRVWAKRR